MKTISTEKEAHRRKIDFIWFFKLATTAVLAASLQSSLVIAGPLQLDMIGQLVISETNHEGKEVEKLSNLPERVLPGSVIEYVISAQNIKNSDLFDIDIIGQIPEGTGFLENSASETPLFSIDGGSSYQLEPVVYTVFENGLEVEKVATPDMYTHVKWIIDTLKNSDQPAFSYRVAVK